MKTVIERLAICVFLLVALPGCGENVAPDPIDLSPYLPQHLSALSVDRSTVRLQWEQPQAVNDTILAGYIMEFAGRRDTVTKTTTDYTASGLLPGLVNFVISPLASDGRTAQGVTMLWAPADRFDDSAYTMFEYNVSDLNRPSGLNVGTRLTNPGTVPVVAAFQESMDLVLVGDAGTVLRFQSAHLVTASWNVTLISTVKSSSTSLDYLLESYPADSTFVLTETLIENNTIYYVIAEGDFPNERNYARIHVREIPGAFPNRSITVTISLQREPSVPFSSAMPDDRPDLAWLPLPEKV
ncbi:MAG: hypothetical protein KAJ12_00210 [Bacteroidetes bacterium]|nr:hypothetical protein [Bacteroidota bacterium]